MGGITWATVKTFNDPERPGGRLYFAFVGKGGWIAVDRPHITAPVARVLSRTTRRHQLRDLQTRLGREIATEK